MHCLVLAIAAKRLAYMNIWLAGMLTRPEKSEAEVEAEAENFGLEVTLASRTYITPLTISKCCTDLKDEPGK